MTDLDLRVTVSAAAAADVLARWRDIRIVRHRGNSPSDRHPDRTLMYLDAELPARPPVTAAAVGDAVATLLQHWAPPPAAPPADPDDGGSWFDDDDEDPEFQSLLEDYEVSHYQRYRLCMHRGRDLDAHEPESSVPSWDDMRRWCRQPTKYRVVRWGVTALWRGDEPVTEGMVVLGYYTACSWEHAKQLLADLQQDPHPRWAQDKDGVLNVHYDIEGWRYEPYHTLVELPEALAGLVSHLGSAAMYARHLAKQHVSSHPTHPRDQQTDRKMAAEYLAWACKRLVEYLDTEAGDQE